MASEVEYVRHHHWFAIEMGFASFRTVYHCRRGPERLYEGIAVYIACHQVESENSGTQRIAGMDYSDVEEAVCDTCPGSYVGVVAILGGVAYSHEKSFFGDGDAIGTYSIYLRIEMDEFSERAAYV